MRKLILLPLVMTLLFGCAGLEKTAGPPAANLWKISGGDLVPSNSAWDVSVPGSVSMGTSTSGLVVVSDADGVVLTSADWGKTVWMTGAGEVALPDAGASDIGKYIVVIVRDASEQVEVVLTDATELFVTTAGTALTAGNEANMATVALSKTTFVYMETGKWYAFGTAITDGGAAD